jgi:hypothetical protein
VENGVSNELVVVTSQGLSFCGEKFPSVIEAAGKKATRRFVEFFTAEIENPNTRRAYAFAVSEFFRWCDQRSLTLEQLQPVIIAGYLKHLAARSVEPRLKGRKKIVLHVEPEDDVDGSRSFVSGNERTPGNEGQQPNQRNREQKSERWTSFHGKGVDILRRLWSVISVVVMRVLWW